MANLRAIFAAFASAARIGFRDLAAAYTVASWALAWMVRVIAQLVFFALFARYVRDDEAAASAAIGMAVLFAGIGGLSSIVATTTERQSGTLGLLRAAPVPGLVVLLGRSCPWVLDGVATSTVAGYLVLGYLGRLTPALAITLPAVAVSVALAACALGCCIGAFVMHVPSARSLALTLGYVVLAITSGAVAYPPMPVTPFGAILPVAHGLGALRLAGAGGSPGAIASEIAAEGLVGLAWLIAAVATIEIAFELGRRRGTLDFGT